MEPLRIALTGVGGRMGRTLLDAVHQDPALTLSAALDLPTAPIVGKTLSAAFALPDQPLPITSDLPAALAVSDCLIDFTRPEGTLACLATCQKYTQDTGRKVALVIGTTGFTEAQKTQIAATAKMLPIVMAPNMAVGVNAVFRLLEVAASILHSSYDVEIIEAHHRLKVDAPSGTALRMGEIVAQGLKRKLADCAVYGREGHTGVRPPQQIGFATVRGGDIVGDHTVLFAGLGERIEITHKSASRMPYALGALRAAHFLRDKEQGLFDMQDVLHLR